MERELWSVLYRLTRRLSSDRSGHVYSVSWIVGVYLWAVIHDRPVSWACRPENWPSSWQVRLPSQSTASRRSRTAAAVELIERLRSCCWQSPHPPEVSFLDGKPLPVGGFSKDPDATRAWRRRPGPRLQAARRLDDRRSWRAKSSRSTSASRRSLGGSCRKSAEAASWPTATTTATRCTRSPHGRA